MSGGTTEVLLSVEFLEKLHNHCIHSIFNSVAEPDLFQWAPSLLGKQIKYKQQLLFHLFVFGKIKLTQSKKNLAPVRKTDF